MRKTHQAVAEGQVQSYFIRLLTACDVFTVILPYCDIKTLLAFYRALTIDNAELQKILPLAQERIAVAHSMITQHLIFSPQKSLRDRAIQTRFLLRENKLTCDFYDNDVLIALSSGHLDFYGKLKILIENANRVVGHIPYELELNIVDFFTRIMENYYSYTGVKVRNQFTRYFSRADEYIPFLNDKNAHLIGSYGVFDVDRIPTLLLTYAQNPKMSMTLNYCWDNLWKAKDNDDKQVQWKAMRCATEFALLLNDKDKMLTCKEAIITLQTWLNFSNDKWHENFFLECQLQTIDLLIKLVVKTESEEEITARWNQLSTLLSDHRTSLCIYATYFLTELALRDKNKIEPCLDLIDRIDRENPRVHSQIWLGFTKLAIALQDNNTIRRYRDLALKTWLHGSYRDNSPSFHIVLLQCATKLTFALNDENELFRLYQVIKSEMFKERFPETSVCLMQLAININTPEILQDCWDLIIKRIEIGSAYSMYNPQILHYLAELTIALKNTENLHQCWTLLLSQKLFPAITDSQERDNQILEIKSLTQFALELKNPDVLMQCWDWMIKRKNLHGIFSLNVDLTLMHCLIQLAFELKDKQKMIMLLSVFNDSSPMGRLFIRSDQIQRILLDAYAAVCADPVCQIDFLASKDIIHYASDLVKKLNQYVVPFLDCLNASNSEEEEHLESILNACFYKRFYEPSAWQESQPSFNKEEFIGAFNALVNSLCEKHAINSLMKHLIKPEAIKIRFLLHETLGNAIFPEECIHDAEKFSHALNVYILHQLRNPIRNGLN